MTGGRGVRLSCRNSPGSPLIPGWLSRPPDSSHHTRGRATQLTRPRPRCPHQLQARHYLQGTRASIPRLDITRPTHHSNSMRETKVTPMSSLLSLVIFILLQMLDRKKDWDDRRGEEDRRQRRDEESSDDGDKKKKQGGCQLLFAALVIGQLCNILRHLVVVVSIIGPPVLQEGSQFLSISRWSCRKHKNIVIHLE